MKPLRISFAVDLAKGPLRFALSGCLLCLTATDLSSESLTLSTYYPAPSGVYTNLITTGNTWLGRDGGLVELGTNAAAGTRLTVMNGFVGFGTTSPANSLEVANGVAKAEGDGSGFVVDTGAGNRRVGLMKYAGWEGALVAGNSSSLRLGHRTDSNDVSAAGGVFRSDLTIDAAGSVAVGPTPASLPFPATVVSGSIDVNGAITVRGCGAPRLVPYGLGITRCTPDTEYVTYYPGYMTTYQTGPSYLNPTGSMYCCACATIPCPSL